MSSHHSQGFQPESVTEGTRQNPSRASRQSTVSGPERINAAYRAASAAARPASVAEGIPPITHSNQSPTLRSPQATRPIPPMAVPGGFDFNTSRNARWETTIETIPDPEEPTIRGNEPGDTFSSPPPTVPRREPLPVPVFSGPSYSRAPSPTVTLVRHPRSGTMVRRREIPGYSGVHMVGGESTHPPTTNSSLSIQIIPITGPSRTPEGLIRAPSGGLEHPVPAYPGSPRPRSPQNEQGAAERFFRALNNIETNLRNEIGVRAAPIPGIGENIIRMQGVTSLIQGRVQTIIDRLNRQDETIQHTVQNTTLTHGNTQEIRREVIELTTETRRIQTQIDLIRRTQEEHTITHNHILTEIQANTGRLETLNAIFQEQEERISEIASQHSQRGRSPSERRSPSFERIGHSTERRRRHHAIAPSPSPERPRIPKEARIACPEPFSGKKGTEAETFMLQMELYYGEYPEVYDNNDLRKIRKLLSNIKEGSSAATVWALPWLKQLGQRNREGALASWETMRQEFLSAFGDPNRRNKAIKEMEELKQLGSAQAYIAKFRSLAQELGWGERELKDRFISGLKPDVRLELTKAPLSNPLAAQWRLNDFITYAAQMDDALYNGRKEKEARESRRTFTGKAGTSTTPGKTDQKRPWVAAEEIARRRKENLCIKCGNAGHRIGDCKVGWKTEGKAEGKRASGKQAEVVEEPETSESEKE